jgi:hypothetical protein
MQVNLLLHHVLCLAQLVFHALHIYAASMHALIVIAASGVAVNRSRHSTIEMLILHRAARHIHLVLLNGPGPQLSCFLASRKPRLPSLLVLHNFSCLKMVLQLVISNLLLPLVSLESHLKKADWQFIRFFIRLELATVIECIFIVPFVENILDSELSFLERCHLMRHGQCGWLLFCHSKELAVSFR